MEGSNTLATDQFMTVFTSSAPVTMIHVVLIRFINEFQYRTSLEQLIQVSLKKRRSATVPPSSGVMPKRYTCASKEVVTEELRCNSNKFKDLGWVVQKPVNANLGLKVNQGFCFSCYKAFALLILSSSLKEFKVEF